MLIWTTLGRLVATLPTWTEIILTRSTKPWILATQMLSKVPSMTMAYQETNEIHNGSLLNHGYDSLIAIIDVLIVRDFGC